MKHTAMLLVASTVPLASCGPAISSAAFVQAAPRPANHEVRFYSTKLPACPYEETGRARVRP